MAQTRTVRRPSDRTCATLGGVCATTRASRRSRAHPRAGDRGEHRDLQRRRRSGAAFVPVRHPEQLVQITMGDGRVDEFTNPLGSAARPAGRVLRNGRLREPPLRPRQRRRDETGRGHMGSGGFFDVLGVRAAAGRILHPADDHRGCAPVAVLAHGFWQRAYGGDAAVIGKTIALNGHPFEIVGVAEPGVLRDRGRARGAALRALCTKAIVDGGAAGSTTPQWYLRIMGRLRDGLRRPCSRAPHGDRTAVFEGPCHRHE